MTTIPAARHTAQHSRAARAARATNTVAMGILGVGAVLAFIGGSVGLAVTLALAALAIPGLLALAESLSGDARRVRGWVADRTRRDRTFP